MFQQLFVTGAGLIVRRGPTSDRADILASHDPGRWPIGADASVVVPHPPRGVEMRTSTCKTFSILGVDALTVNVAAAAEPGPDRFALVGLSETSIRECAVRVETAIEAAGFLWPKGRITVDLAPADLHKEGSGFDLPIAAAILAASRQIGPLDGLALVGEIAFDGRVLPIRGALPAALEAGRGAILVIPEGNALEASAAEAGCVLSLSHISELPDLLTTLRSVQEQHPSLAWTKEPSGIPAWFPTDPSSIDMADVRGQPAARRAMEVAAAGGHSLLLQGPPGTGKTMLARRLTTILPPLTRPEAVETSTVYSTRGRSKPRRSTPPAGCSPPARACSGPGPFGPPTTRSAPRPLWVEGSAGQGRARSPWPTTACCSWTSCRSSSGRPWTCSRRRWRAERWPSAGQVARCGSRPRSSSWLR